MNLSNIVTRIKLKLGLMAISTPFENIDEVIVEILNTITTPVFSIYQPCKETLHLNTGDLQEFDRTDQYHAYYLPEWKNRKLLYVFDVYYDETSMNGFGYYGSIMPMVTGNTFMQAMLTNVNAQMTQQVVPKMTFHYEAPRKLYIYNMFASSAFTLDLGFEHDKTLASIDESCRESYMKLALLDVKANLYPTIKMYSEINSVHGNVNLKLDGWENAENEQAELLQRWDETYHLDLQPFYYY